MFAFNQEEEYHDQIQVVSPILPPKIAIFARLTLTHRFRSRMKTAAWWSKQGNVVLVPYLYPTPLSREKNEQDWK
jgi:hypothetical protein